MDKRLLSLLGVLAFVVALSVPLVEAGTLSSDPGFVTLASDLQGFLRGSDTLIGQTFVGAKVIFKENGVSGPGTTITTDGTQYLGLLGEHNWIIGALGAPAYDLIFRQPSYKAQGLTYPMTADPVNQYDVVLQKLPR